MNRYFAEIENRLVRRVIVADSKEWCESRLGGTWEESRDLYAEVQSDPNLEPVVYCGPGYGYDAAFPEKFALPWVQPAPEMDTGEWSSYPKGAVVAHGGRFWKSTVDGNVWGPGVSAWHDEPEIEGVLPQWVAPTGSHDTYPEGFEVTHNGKEWVSQHPANVWIPGTDSSLWQIIQDVSSETIPDWTPWDGHNENLYQTGDEVMYNGQHWISTSGNNHYEPGVFGWELV